MSDQNYCKQHPQMSEAFKRMLETMEPMPTVENLTDKVNRLWDEKDALQQRYDALAELCERLKQEAQIHAQEARTQKSTVLEIYQALGIQQGDWNGAKPVVDMVGSLVANNTKLLQELRSVDEKSDALAASHAELLAAARCIQHWHDVELSGGDGMVVSAEHVRLLWAAIANAEGMK